MNISTQLAFLVLIGLNRSHAKPNNKNFTITRPVIKNALFSENIYKTIKGTQVQCILPKLDTADTDEYTFKSSLYLKDSQSNDIEIMPVISVSSALNINTSVLNPSELYQCCIEIDNSDERNLARCTFLRVSPLISKDFTLVAKYIGVLEMLVCLLMFSLCLIMAVCRFKLRQKKRIIEIAQEKVTNFKPDGSSGPYLVSPNAKNFQTGVGFVQPGSNGLKFSQSLSEYKENFKGVPNLNEFPPSYEELVLSRMDSQINRY